MKRPGIKNIKTGEELKRWYWLKEELTAFCKMKKLSYAGTKFDILERIANVIDKGVSDFKISINKPTSKFVWSRSKLTLNTIVTDTYTNGPNTRKFFKEHCGDKFHFSIPFMKFMKNNCGKTLEDAVKEWERLHELSKQKNFKSDIPSGNQYNQYIRDFFADNPGKTITEARHFWKLKKSLPLGKHIYEKKYTLLK